MKRFVCCLLLISILFSNVALASSSKIDKVLSIAVKQIGTPYEFVSNVPKSFNCFSFVAYCFNKVQSGIISQSGVSGNYKKISLVKDVKVGDILVFKSSSFLSGIMGYHFGIYLGHGYFIHANKNDGVTVSKLKLYKKRFVGAIRVF